jgi:hypothetical protein
MKGWYRYPLYTIKCSVITFLTLLVINLPVPVVLLFHTALTSPPPHYSLTHALTLSAISSLHFVTFLGTPAPQCPHPSHFS